MVTKSTKVNDKHDHTFTRYVVRKSDKKDGYTTKSHFRCTSCGLKTKVLCMRSDVLIKTRIVDYTNTIPVSNSLDQIYKAIVTFLDSLKSNELLSRVLKEEMRC
jgi:hypothetical protein